MNTTKRIEKTVTALEKGQLKNALFLTDRPETQRHHQWVQEAAQTCLANKGDKEVCTEAIKVAKEKVEETMTLPMDDTGLEGLEDYLTPGGEATETEQREKTDEELYEECIECHVANAVVEFGLVCRELPEQSGAACAVISKKLENDLTEPTDWIKTMVEVAEQAQGEAKERMAVALTELTDYLEGRDSPLLKALDKEGGNG